MNHVQVFEKSVVRIIGDITAYTSPGFMIYFL